MSEKNTQRDRVLMRIYKNSRKTSYLSLMVVMLLEVFMLAYTIVRPALFGDRIGKYRMCYIALLALAALYLLLNYYVCKDEPRRFRLLNVANPLCAILSTYGRCTSPIPTFRRAARSIPRYS